MQLLMKLHSNEPVKPRSLVSTNKNGSMLYTTPGVQTKKSYNLTKLVLESKLNMEYSLMP